jgi:hypothetical protein
VRLFSKFFDRRLWSVQVPPHKLIVSSKGGVELYDLSRDPAERDDLAGSEPALRDRLRTRLDALRAEHPPLYDADARAELSEQTRDALENLGYLEPD